MVRIRLALSERSGKEAAILMKVGSGTKVTSLDELAAAAVAKLLPGGNPSLMEFYVGNDRLLDIDDVEPNDIVLARLRSLADSAGTGAHRRRRSNSTETRARAVTTPYPQHESGHRPPLRTGASAILDNLQLHGRGSVEVVQGKVSGVMTRSRTGNIAQQSTVPAVAVQLPKQPPPIPEWFLNGSEPPSNTVAPRAELRVRAYTTDASAARRSNEPGLRTADHKKTPIPPGLPPQRRDAGLRERLAAPPRHSVVEMVAHL